MGEWLHIGMGVRCYCVGRSPLALEVAGRRLYSLGKVPGSVWGWEMLSPLWGLFTSCAWAGSSSPGTTKSLKPDTNGSGLLMDTGPCHLLRSHRCFLLSSPCPTPAHPCPVPAGRLPAAVSLAGLCWWCPGGGLCWAVPCRAVLSP